MQGVEAKTHEGVSYLEVSFLTRHGGLAAAFSTRGGGVSRPPFDTLNLGLHVGDEAQDVVTNRRLLTRALGLELGKAVSGAQVHGARVAVVASDDAGRGAYDQSAALPDVDALVTAEAGLTLMAFYADCVPIWYYAPRRRVAALAHAGWRGTVGLVGVNTVKVLGERWGIAPAEIFAFIGPSIGSCCYVVGDEVVRACRAVVPHWTKCLHQEMPGQWRLDLWEANRLLLRHEARLPEANIGVAGMCTSCRNDLFFSYRAHGGRTGRMAALISMK